MTYTTPELLLVGAANALVQINFSEMKGCVIDNPDDDPISDLLELW